MLREAHRQQMSSPSGFSGVTGIGLCGSEILLLDLQFHESSFLPTQLASVGSELLVFHEHILASHGMDCV